MGAVNILIGGFILVIFLLVFMQPVILLVDTASSVISEKNTTHQGTNSDGEIVDVGDSIWGADLLLGFLAAIGFAFFIGFVIWAGRGGKDPYEDFRGGFRQ